MTRGETGLETLIDAGQLPAVPHFPETLTWEDALSQIDWLSEGGHEYKTLVIDTLNGLERLCHEHVCARDYGGKWDKTGFTSYQQGYEVSLADWRHLLSALDGLRESGMGVICLCHAKVAPFRNPEGADYDRWEADLHRKTWGLSHKWADLIGFLHFETFVDEDGNRPKGRGGTQRMLYTTRTAAWDAKNRFGLPSEIELPNSPKEAWATFMAAVKAAKNSNAKKA